MIHVSVGKKDHVNGGQRFDCNAGTPLAAQDNQAFGEDRVYEQLPPMHLEEKRGVANESNSKLGGVH
jgi:hypothetical protein